MYPTLSEWKSGGERFDHRGRSIFFRRSAESRRPLLCLHGFPTSSFDYRKIWEPLTARFPLVAYDMIGYGVSDKPTDAAYTTAEQADLVEGLTARIKAESVNILAHDYGNTITLELIARREEGRLGFGIDSICFMNGAVFPETHRPIFAQRLLAGRLGPLFGRMVPDSVFKRSLSRVFGPATKPTAEELEDAVWLFRHNGGKRIAHKLIRYMAERERFRERWLAALRSIREPFRMINGAADPVSGAHLVARFRELVPGQQDIIEMEGIGHFPHLEAPEATAGHLIDHFGRLGWFERRVGPEAERSPEGGGATRPQAQSSAKS